MKDKLKIVFAIAMILIGSMSTLSAQAVKKGNVIVDPYYGWPNFGSTLVSFVEDAIRQETGNFDTDFELNSRLVGPAGLRAEYMIADQFGIGFDFIYNSASITTVDSVFLDGSATAQEYDLTGFARRFRFQVRANYHFVQDDNFDAYVGFGAGTNTRSLGFNTDSPNFVNATPVVGALIPFSLRLALGGRYYFTNNLGANFEIGLGGPILSAGLSLKF